jgi:hypothetical protein
VRSRNDALLALAFGSLTAVVSRIMLLAHIDATSVPAVNLLYVSPASPFVILANQLRVLLTAAAYVLMQELHLQAAHTTVSELKSGQSVNGC